MVRRWLLTGLVVAPFMGASAWAQSMPAAERALCDSVHPGAACFRLSVGPAAGFSYDGRVTPAAGAELRSTWNLGPIEVGILAELLGVGAPLRLHASGAATISGAWPFSGLWRFTPLIGLGADLDTQSQTTAPFAVVGVGLQLAFSAHVSLGASISAQAVRSSTWQGRLIVSPSLELTF